MELPQTEPKKLITQVKVLSSPTTSYLENCLNSELAIIAKNNGTVVEVNFLQPFALPKYLSMGEWHSARYGAYIIYVN